MRWVAGAGVAVLLIPFVCAVLLVAPMAYRFIPLITGDLVSIYEAVAASVEHQMRGRTTDGREVPEIPWPALIAIDAVRYRQDFDRATPGSVEELAWTFVERHREVHNHCEGSDPIDPDLPYCYVEIHTWYTPREMAAVFESLGLGAEDQGWFQDLMDTIERYPEILRGG